MRRLPGETIAAISTALGPGAIAIVRLSGEDAIDVADRVFRGGRKLSLCASHTVHHGSVVDGSGSTIDEVLATVMLSPNTYTTEHMIEFGCHGGPLPARAVLAACLEAGAREAGPGEFTERAFMNGRLDLVQAEAVADVVAARTPRGLDLALRQLYGGLSSRLDALREVLLDMRVVVEAAIDMPEDVDSEDARARVLALSEDARSRAQALLTNCDLGVAVREGLIVAIVGKPNVGKSSLMNALVSRERSIVTASPGTTRDTVEACLNVSGVPMTLVDTAGWREVEDEAERAGVARAQAVAESASLCLMVVDASSEPDGEDQAVARALAPERTVVVRNKVDLGAAADAATWQRLFGGRSGWVGPAGAESEEVEPHDRSRGRSNSVPSDTSSVDVSALTREGLDTLMDVVVRACLAAPDQPAAVTNVRHVHALREVLNCLNRLDEASTGGPFEIMGSELSQATYALGQISGETTPEEVLERIFERFCVGK